MQRIRFNSSVWCLMMCVVLVAVLLALSTLTPVAHAAGVVSVCDEASLVTALAGGGTVTFSCSGTITLTSTITISLNTTLDGAGQTVTINGNNAVQVFLVNSGVTFSLQNLTVANGKCGSSCSSGIGGGIDSHGTVNVTNSTFSGNQALGSAGGIFNEPGGTLTLTDSTFSGNFGPAYGGGIFNVGTMTVTNSTFSGNSAVSGGGIYNAGTATVTNSTFSGNSAAAVGGGIDNAGTATVTNSTFSGNSAAVGGGIYNNAGTTATAKNSIIANSTSGNCSGTITDGGGNLVWGDATCPGINADPKLGTLASNGGATQTLALGQDSAAIDAASAASCPATDHAGRRAMIWVATLARTSEKSLMAIPSRSHPVPRN